MCNIGCYTCIVYTILVSILHGMAIYSICICMHRRIGSLAQVYYEYDIGIGWGARISNRPRPFFHEMRILRSNPDLYYCSFRASIVIVVGQKRAGRLKCRLMLLLWLQPETERTHIFEYLCTWTEKRNNTNVVDDGFFFFFFYLIVGCKHMYLKAHR